MFEALGQGSNLNPTVDPLGAAVMCQRFAIGIVGFEILDYFGIGPMGNWPQRRRRRFVG